MLYVISVLQLNSYYIYIFGIAHDVSFTMEGDVSTFDSIEFVNKMSSALHVSPKSIQVLKVSRYVL